MDKKLETLKEIQEHYQIDPDEFVYGINITGKECQDAALSNFISNIASRQRTIIDYDEDCDVFMIRCYPMNYGGKDEGLKIQPEKNIKRTLRNLDAGKILPE